MSESFPFDSPPPSPPDISSTPVHPAARLPWTPGEIVAWLLIVTAVVLAVWSTERQKHSPAITPATAPAALDAAPPEPGEALSDARQNMATIGRYVVGLHEISRHFGFADNPNTTTAPASRAATLGDAAPSTNPAAAPDAGGSALSMDTRLLLTQVDRAAKTPADRALAAVVYGEMAGKTEALRRLEALAESQPELAPDIAALRALYTDPNPNPNTWPYLKSNLGWFAEMAAGTDKPDGNTHRSAALAASLRTVIALISATTAAVVAMVVGLVLLIRMLRRLHARQLPLAFDRPVEAGGAGTLPADRRTYLFAFAFLMLGFMTFGTLFRALLHTLHLPAEWALLALPVAFLIAALLPLAAGQSWKQWRTTVGLVAPRGVRREILAGFKGYLAGLPLLGVGIALVLMLSKYSGENPTHPITQELGGGPLSLFLIFLLASVWAPISEEILFRGMLFAHLRQRFGWWISAPIVALIFAAIHPQGWAAIPALAALALVFAAIREWRGSIIGCMAAHALNNTVVLAIAVVALN